jgi:Family of unknown function (DUF6460)
MAMTNDHFLGGSPGSVLLKLALASIMVGVVLSVSGYDPYDLYNAVVNLGEWLTRHGLGALHAVFRYLALGALIVVPVWILSRLFTLLRSRRSSGQE